MRLVDGIARLATKYENKTAWIERSANLAIKGFKDRNENQAGATSQIQYSTWSWGDICVLTASTAIRLMELGVERQDRICNLGRNSLGWAILDLACSAINAIHVPIDARIGLAQCDACIELVAPKLLFLDDGADFSRFAERRILALQSLIHASSKESLERLCTPYDANDVANILFTSGTTGTNKGVMLTHRNLVTNAFAKLDAMPQVSEDHRLNFLPFSHAYARTCELSTWLLSYSSMETTSGIESVLDQASLSQPTLINGVPLFFERLEKLWADRSGSTSSLFEILGSKIRRLASGGAPISGTLRKRFELAGLPVFQGYGLTEASPVVCSNRKAKSLSDDHDKSDHLIEVGPAVKGVHVKIDDDSRLWVSGDGVMKGYWNDPVETQRRIVNGWLDTGDLAEYVLSNESTKSRAIRILGRADDTIVLSSGYKIFPFAIEQLLRTQSWVRECMLVGNDRPFSILLLKPNLDIMQSEVESQKESSLHERTRSLLSSFPHYALPKAVLVCDEDWTTQSGLANFKGGLRRAKIEAFYSTTIELAYQKTRNLS